MIDRFDLEQQIQDCWEVTKDLNYLQDLAEDSDKLLNALIGVESIYEIKFNRLFATFEQLIRQGNIT
jgi:hypothetical protein